jgi:hypothetical protein
LGVVPQCFAHGIVANADAKMIENSHHPLQVPGTGREKVESYHCLKYVCVTGAVVSSRVTYSGCGYDSIIIRVEEDSYENNPENIVVTSNAIIYQIGAIVMKTEIHTRGPYAPHILRLSVSLLPTRYRSVSFFSEHHSFAPSSHRMILNPLARLLSIV